VKNLSYQMRLFGIHQACERTAAEAFSQQLHPLEFLRLLLEEELLSRKDRTAKALVTKARFRFRADLEDLDLAFHKDLTKVRIPDQIGHLFRSKPATHSGPIRPPFRSKPATPWVDLSDAG
jgi:hypothetical protein